MTFDNLGISEQILQAVNELNFHEPTDIQRRSIPVILDGKDLFAESATGSGKTFAFGVGIIEHVNKGKGIQALILTPTRELAEQVVGELKKFSKHKRLSITSVYGGVAINPQMDALRKADIVVATPGRLLDHMERRTIDLSKINQVVLDEADRMLDMGFIDDVTKILSRCPKKRQTLLFTATLPVEVTKLCKKFMNDPVKVKVKNYVDPSKLKQIYYDVRDNMKFSLLAHLLKNEDSGLVMVFCNSRAVVNNVAKSLNKAKIESLGIHGGLTQSKRNAVLDKFNSNDVFVLVCTDVAARGLDIPNVSHVYNYEIPNDPKQYIHRIGRTARAGKNGIVVNLICNNDHKNFDAVMMDDKIKIKREPLMKFPRVQFFRENSQQRRPSFRGGNGRQNGHSRSGFGRSGPSRSGGHSRGGSRRSAPRGRSFRR